VSALHISGPRTSKPGISVVVATYNRPRALRCALESVRRQTFDDWEVVVVGDHCTDCTPDVVASFADPRLRYVDLARNIGEQSGPNNIGIHLAQAPLIAFLNHDDLWFPDHLQVAHEGIVATGADLVFTASLAVHPKAGPFDADDLLVTLESVGVDGAYDPARVDCFVPASTWLARRAALDALRGWRAARDLSAEPSQDVLARAVRRGFALRAVPAVTVMTVPSGLRPGSYAEGAATEQEALLPRLDDVDWRLRLMASDPRTTAAGAARHARSTPRRARLWARVLHLAPVLGRSARELDYRVRRRQRRGGYVRSLRQIRGLLDVRNDAGDRERVRFSETRRHGAFPLGERQECRAEGPGLRFLTAGWASPESSGVWNDGTCAQVAFDVHPAPQGTLTVHLLLTAHLSTEITRQRLVARSRGVVLGELVLDPKRPSAQWSIDVPGPAASRTLVLDLEFPDAASCGHDERELAVLLHAIDITGG
jgi:hypothetical protein